MVILSITPWLPTYMGQSLIRCNSLFKPGQWVVNSAQIAATKAFALPVSHENNMRAAGKSDPNWVATLETLRAGSELVTSGFAEKDGLLLLEN